MTPAELVGAAVAMLDEESHRYVERFVDCPNGCRYEYLPYSTPPATVRVAGPADCQDCDLGQVEDENAEHLNPFIDELRRFVGRLEQAQGALASVSDTESWPEHLTCSEAEALATIVRAFGADPLAEAIIASHAYGDDDEDDQHYDAALQRR